MRFANGPLQTPSNSNRKFKSSFAQKAGVLDLMPPLGPAGPCADLTGNGALEPGEAGAAHPSSDAPQTAKPPDAGEECP